jgi:WD40 repeat protein
MKKIVLLVFLLSLSFAFPSLAQVNGDNDTIWTKLTADYVDIKFSPDNQKIIAREYWADILEGCTLQIYETSNGNFLQKLDSAWYLMVDSARNRIYTTFLKKLYAWDIDTYEKFDYFEPAEKDVRLPTYSAKNNRLAAVIGYPHYALYEGVIKVWDCQTGKVILSKKYEYFNNPETGHSFPPGFINIKFNDGLNILSVYVQYGDYRDENDPHGSSYISKEIFEVYDASTFALKSNDTILSNYFYMSESGKYVVIFERQPDGKDDMRVLRTDDYSEVMRVPVINRENVSSIKISKDDKYLIYALGHIKVFDLINRKEIYDYNVGTNRCLDISDDNHYIVSAGAILALLSTPWYTSVPYENDIDAVISFPNPVENIINIDFTLLKQGLTSIEIFDVTGKSVNKLYDGFLNEGQHHYRFDLNGICSGAYILSIRTGEYVFREKIIKTK